ncbi:hypothetical protein [Chromobacterium haemolyticum]|uniref:hypothetical protein n=1 Tax=Chromobacterium haemolyticum TaxID=394935 RepID=UPI001746D36F|nr:hypothetical protein [Chromobacterium haemolyticum]QOD85054.1 hypothetical protein IEZ30_11475 [Chromobacterium haemolyticum]
MMAILYVLGVAPLIALPLLPGLLELLRKTDASALGINRLHTGTADVFARNYRQRLETLDLGERRQDWNARLDAIGPENRPVVDEEVLAAGELRIPARFSFLKEIHCDDNVVTGPGVILRSVLADGDLNLGRSSSILRWAGARNVRIEPDSLLFGRTVAEDTLDISGPVRFQRLQAATIRMGETPRHQPPATPLREVDVESLETPHPFNSEMRRAVMDGDFLLPENSLLRGHLVVRGGLSIGPGCRIEGSVKASGPVRLARGVVVDGAVVSDDSIICRENCLLLGPVVADRIVVIGAHSVLGAPDSPNTVSSRLVLLTPPLIAHGTIWARIRGKVRGR